jgi:hypothetical protein
LETAPELKTYTNVFANVPKAKYGSIFVNDCGKKKVELIRKMSENLPEI